MLHHYPLSPSDSSPFAEGEATNSPIVSSGNELSATPQPQDTRQGFLFAGAAYLIWGFLPLYLKAMAHIPALEIVPHRIIWSVPLAALIVWWQGVGGAVWRALTSKRTMLLALITATLLSMNWLTYVWAVTNGHTVEAALGYYINPLFSVFLAAVLIKEKLTSAQWAAISLAVLAVGILTWEAGGVPWMSLFLTVSWGFYAYFKRTLAIGATEGFFLEVLIVLLPALAYWFWLNENGASHFMTTSWRDTALLAGASIFTAIPLICYAHGAKGLRLSTIAIMQYSAPTMVFLIAVFVFKEPFSLGKLAAFLLIWLALAVYTWTLIKKA